MIKLVNFYLNTIKEVDSFEFWAPNSSPIKKRNTKSRILSRISLTPRSTQPSRQKRMRTATTNDGSKKYSPMGSVDLQQGRTYTPLQNKLGRRRQHKTNDFNINKPTFDDSVSKISLPIRESEKFRENTSDPSKLATPSSSEFQIKNKKLHNFIESFTEIEDNLIPSPKFGSSLNFQERKSSLNSHL